MGLFATLLIVVSYVPGVFLLAPISLFIPDEQLEHPGFMHIVMFLSAVFYLGCLVASRGDAAYMALSAFLFVLTLVAFALFRRPSDH